MSTRYEVTETDGNGRVTHTEHFTAAERDAAIHYRQEHPQSTGWTIRTMASGSRDREVGLHAETRWE